MVDADPTGGPPIGIGVTQRITTQEFEDGVVEVFEPPCQKVEMPPVLTRAQIEQVNKLRKEWRKPGDHVRVWRNCPTGAEIQISGEADATVALAAGDSAAYLDLSRAG